jgi:hypothetical protein
MSISGSENIEKFKAIGFLQERKNEKLRKMNTVKQIYRINKVLVSPLKSDEAGKE